MSLFWGCHRLLVSSIICELLSRDMMLTSIQLPHEKQSEIAIMSNWVLLSHTWSCFGGVKALCSYKGQHETLENQTPAASGYSFSGLPEVHGDPLLQGAEW